MADISRITALDGVTYDIKDATARSGVMPYGTTTGTSSAYAVSASQVSSLTAGTALAVRFHADNAASATLNVNDLGAKPIYHNGAVLTAAQISAYDTVMLIYETASLSTGCWSIIGKKSSMSVSGTTLIFD